MNDCQECGMLIEEAKEYHPYAACLMFLGCRDSEKVRANLAGVVAHGAQYDSGFDDMADRIRALEAELAASHQAENNAHRCHEETIKRYDAAQGLIRALETELVESEKHRAKNRETAVALQLRVSALEAALREAMEWNWMEDGVPAEVEERIQTALGSTVETPVSTLCAVCDQIKELHPATHEWTARETKAESKQPEKYAAHSPKCWLREYNEGGFCDCGVDSQANRGSVK